MGRWKCTDNCFECRYADCIANAAYVTQWEKEFNARQRKIRQDKKRNKTNGAPGYGTLLKMRLR